MKWLTAINGDDKCKCSSLYLQKSLGGCKAAANTPFTLVWALHGDSVSPTCQCADKKADPGFCKAGCRSSNQYYRLAASSATAPLFPFVSHPLYWGRQSTLWEQQQGAFFRQVEIFPFPSILSNTFLSLSIPPFLPNPSLLLLNGG